VYRQNAWNTFINESGLFVLCVGSFFILPRYTHTHTSTYNKALAFNNVHCANTYDNNIILQFIYTHIISMIYVVVPSSEKPFECLRERERAPIADGSDSTATQSQSSSHINVFVFCSYTEVHMYSSLDSNRNRKKNICFFPWAAYRAKKKNTNTNIMETIKICGHRHIFLLWIVF
jgi:hypothetical protein